RVLHRRALARPRGNRRGLRAAAPRGGRVHRLVRHGHAHLAALRQPLPARHRAAQPEPRASHRVPGGRPARPRHPRRRRLDGRLAPRAHGARGASRPRAPARSFALVARVLSREVEPAPDRSSKGALGALIEGELGRPVPPAVAALARQLAERAGNGAAAVLFYGSVLRDGALDGALEGVLDYYVLVDRLADWRGSPLAAAAGRLLPPNVGYLETTVEGRVLRAKYAVMTLGQFRRAMSERSLDTTV